MNEEQKCDYCIEKGNCILYELDRAYMCYCTLEELKDETEDVSIDKNNKI